MVYRTKFIDWHNFNRHPKTDVFCAICQKDIKGKPRFYIHAVDGHACCVLHPEDEQLYTPDGGDFGALPVGPDCARRVGLEWCHKG